MLLLLNIFFNSRFFKKCQLMHPTEMWTVTVLIYGVSIKCKTSYKSSNNLGF